MQYTQYCTGCSEILTDPLSCTDSSTFSLVSNKDERKFVSSKDTAQMYSTIRTRQPRCGSLNIILLANKYRSENSFKPWNWQYFRTHSLYLYFPCKLVAFISCRVIL